MRKLRKKLHSTPVWFIFLVVAFVAVAGTMVRVSAQRGRDNDHDRDDRRSFQRNDDDWDDHDNLHRRDNYAIGLWGDLPYSDVQTYALTDLIADMNSQDLAFTAHDGDLKAGKSTPLSATPTKCTDDKYLQFHDPVLLNGFFDQLKAPVIFTPGDNDWTDCDNSGATTNGPYNSLERLDHERGLFFNTSLTLGQHHLHQAVQGVTPGVDQTSCKGFLPGTVTPPLDVLGHVLDTNAWKDVPCVENRRWTYRGVTYATLNVQGSCNNRCKDHPDDVEWAARRDADIAWMKETFKVAKDRNSAAVMLISQADPGFGNRPVESEPNRDPKTLVCTLNPAATNPCTAAFPGTPDGFYAFLTALRDEAEAFGKPVVYVHGDSHYFRIDKPLYDLKPDDAVSTTGRRLENFTRVETFGDNVFVDAANKPLPNAIPDDRNNVHWVKVYVDPDSREVFAFQPQIVPQNRPLVPAP